MTFKMCRRCELKLLKMYRKLVSMDGGKGGKDFSHILSFVNYTVPQMETKDAQSRKNDQDTQCVLFLEPKHRVAPVICACHPKSMERCLLVHTPPACVAGIAGFQVVRFFF